MDVPRGSGAGARAHRTDGLAEVGAVPLSRPRLTTCGSQGGSRLTPPPPRPLPPHLQLQLGSHKLRRHRLIEPRFYQKHQCEGGKSSTRDE